jgi:hypothetical protein
MRNKRFVLDPNISAKKNPERKYKKLTILTKKEFEQMFA